jgi:hypothetical protein
MNKFLNIEAEITFLESANDGHPWILDITLFYKTDKFTFASPFRGLPVISQVLTLPTQVDAINAVPAVIRRLLEDHNLLENVPA